MERVLLLAAMFTISVNALFQPNLNLNIKFRASSSFSYSDYITPYLLISSSPQLLHSTVPNNCTVRPPLSFFRRLGNETKETFLHGARPLFRFAGAACSALAPCLGSRAQRRQRTIAFEHLLFLFVSAGACCPTQGRVDRVLDLHPHVRATALYLGSIPLAHLPERNGAITTLRAQSAAAGSVSPLRSRLKQHETH